MLLGNLRRWLWSWLHDDDDRLIFRYWDGSRWRRADPVVLIRALDAHPKFNWDRHVQGCDDGDDESIRVTVKAVHDVFGVTALGAKGGLTETECIALFRDFALFCGAIKKKLDRSPTSPANMESRCLAGSTTSCDSDCTSTSVGSVCAPPPV